MLNPDTFRCERCGKCCEMSIVRISKEDIKRIKREGYDENYFIKRDIMSPGLNKFVIKKIGNKCIFLKKKNGKYFCEIYKVRPLTCQRYPFFKKDVKSCKPEHVILPYYKKVFK